jgi:serine/threonine-protein kinase PRP4
MELDLPPSPPPVKDMLAVLRAKRQAIVAKYSFAGDSTPSQSRSPSSAVQPPLPSSSLSDPVTLAPSPTAAAGVMVDGHGALPETPVDRVTIGLNGVMG